MTKKALITGITGQDGAYLAEYLLKKGYEVHGMKRRSSLFNTDRIDHLYQDPHLEHRNLILHYGDLTDSMNITRLIQEVQPDEIYNLAAMSHVHVSFQTPEYVGNADGLGTLRILEAVRLLGLTEKTRIYQASTSELYGLVQEVPQSERTPFYPRSPYAVAKLYAYWITVNYREAYKMHASNGILFNHESPIRGETFVTRKVTRALSRVALGMQDKFYMGNLSSQRDWGHAKAIRDFITMAAKEIGLTLEFKGEGVDEKGYITAVDASVFSEKVGEKYLSAIRERIANNPEVVNVDPQYFRPTEVDLLIGDPTKSQTVLGWKPEYDLKGLIEDMMRSDIKLFKRDAYLKEGGFTVMNYFE